MARRKILLVSPLASLLVASIGTEVCSASPALARQAVSATTGAIVGKVADGTGAVLPGVVIVITSDALMGTRKALTTGDGLYQFPGVPPGEYQLIFTLQGFASLTRKGVYVGLGSTSTVNVALGVADYSTTSASSPNRRFWRRGR